MITLTRKQKKELFDKCMLKAKATGKKGEELMDEVWFLIEEQYDRWDPLNGMTYDEQIGYDEEWPKWTGEER